MIFKRCAMRLSLFLTVILTERKTPLVQKDIIMYNIQTLGTYYQLTLCLKQVLYCVLSCSLLL